MPGHQLVDAALWPAVDETRQQLGEVDLRIDAVQLAGLDQGGQVRPAAPAVVSTCEQDILSAQANHRVILPISGLRSSSTTAGIRCTGGGCGGTAASGGPAA